jgi:membrane protein implicated in regulation of membrane protease activity
MIILGLLLLAAAATAAVELIVANDDAQITVDMWRWSWTVDAFWLAVAGAAILVVALLGLFMLKAGSRRARRLRRERRELARENRQLAERAEVAEATDAEAVGDVPPQGYDAPRQGYVPPAESTGVRPVTRPDYARPAQETYAGEPVEGRHADR